ncbi:uncharacterized protein LOC144328495 [Podarcis muralis]
MASKRKASEGPSMASSTKRPIKGPSQALRSPEPNQSLRRIQSMVTGLANDPAALARVEAEMGDMLQRCSTPSTSSARPAPPGGAPSLVASSSDGESDFIAAGGYLPDASGQPPSSPEPPAATPRGRRGTRGTARKRASARGRAARATGAPPSRVARAASGHSQVVSSRPILNADQQGDASESSVEDSLLPPPRASSGGRRRRKKSRKRAKKGRRDTSSSLSGQAPTRIWIMGHSIVHWAARRARQSGLGDDLGLPQEVKVSWFARRGMLWKELLPLIQRRVLLEGPPTAIVIQLGENDLVSHSCFVLRAMILGDLRDVAAMVPPTKIIWSKLLQRRKWRGSPCVEATERSRKRINAAVSKLVADLGGFVISHPLIRFKATELFMTDGVHLSSVGNDVWLSSVVDKLRECLRL